MAVLHITEAELARDLHAVLEKIQNGAEVIVERDARAVGVMKPAPQGGRPIDECIALARAYQQRLGYAPVPDPHFHRGCPGVD